MSTPAKLRCFNGLGPLVTIREAQSCASFAPIMDVESCKPVTTRLPIATMDFSFSTAFIQNVECEDIPCAPDAEEVRSGAGTTNESLLSAQLGQQSALNHEVVELCVSLPPPRVAPSNRLPGRTPPMDIPADDDAMHVGTPLERQLQLMLRPSLRSESPGTIHQQGIISTATNLCGGAHNP